MVSFIKKPIEEERRIWIEGKEVFEEFYNSNQWVKTFFSKFEVDLKGIICKTFFCF